MIRHFIIVLLTLNVSFFFAQTWQWAHSGNSPYSAEGIACCNDPDGNVIITGGGTQITFGPYSVQGGNYITKYDPSGNVLLAKSVNGGTSGSIHTDASGNIFITGSNVGNMNSALTPSQAEEHTWLNLMGMAISSGPRDRFQCT